MKERIEWIDILKGISIIMVVIGHIDYCPMFLNYFFDPFFLTAFLFCYGYTFNSSISLKEFSKKRIKTLLIPLIFFSLLIILTRYIFTLSEHNGLIIDLKQMLLQIRGQGDDLWFIALMFIASFPFYFISKLVKNRKVYIPILVLCFCSSYIYDRVCGIALPWHLQIVGSAILYMGIGYYCNKWKVQLNIKRDIKGSIFVVLATIIYIVSIFINISILKNTSFTFYSYSNNIVMYIIITVLGLIMSISVAKYISKSNILSFFGKNTLLIFALHGKIERVLIVLTNSILSKEVLEVNNSLNNFVVTISITIITLVILIIPIKIINKYFPFLLGRKGERNEKN